LNDRKNKIDVNRFSKIYIEYLIVLSKDSTAIQHKSQHLNPILAKHKVTEKQFRATFSAIKQDPVKMEQFLSAVVDSLNDRLKL
jgi:hypothetical protein